MKAIILAGGKGTRLWPQTAVCPKPMMPVGGKPILELVIRQLESYGFHEIIICVGYLSELITTFFGNGDRYNVSIRYSHESNPLGTVGGLSLVKNELTEPFLVINGDTLTTLNYADLAAYHERNGDTATIALKKRSVYVDFGVAELDNDKRVNNYLEKPALDYLVSMGVYIFDPAVLEYIEHNAYLDFPELVTKLILYKKHVRGYIFDGYWLDVGRPEDYEKAKEDIKTLHIIT